MNIELRRTANGFVVLEIAMTEEQALDLRRSLGELLRVEKPRPKPAAWVPLKDRPGMPTSAPKPTTPIRVRGT